jgi:hypothetical protein
MPLFHFCYKESINFYHKAEPLLQEDEMLPVNSRISLV